MSGRRRKERRENLIVVLSVTGLLLLTAVGVYLGVRYRQPAIAASIGGGAIFIGIVLLPRFSRMWHRDSNKNGALFRALDAKKLMLFMPMSPSGFLSGLVRKVAEKAGLIALFTLISPRREKIVSIQKKPSTDTAEILELFKEIADHPENAKWAVSLLHEFDSPLQWPMLYASEYYINGSHDRAAWDLFIRGLILVEGKASLSEAEPLLRKAAEEGFLPACVALGDLYLGQKEWHKSLQAVIPASDAGYAPALHTHAYYIYLSTLGKLFQYKSMKEAFRLFSVAAEKGYPPAMSVVGKMYLNGYGAAVAADPEIGRSYLERAYNAGELLR